MNAPHSTEPSKKQTKQQKQRQRVYIPPTPDVIDQYAHAVYRQLGQGEGELQPSPTNTREFANFIKVVVRITTKHLNEGAKICP